jgi:hypothetical protein
MNQKRHHQVQNWPSTQGAHVALSQSTPSSLKGKVDWATEAWRSLIASLTCHEWKGQLGFRLPLRKQ